MISYEPLFETMQKKGITEYNLIYKQGMSANTIHRIKKGLPFTYYIKGGELFASRRERSITRSTFERALQKIQENPEEISGPKKLNVYGAPYVWAVLATILGAESDKEE